MLAVVAAALWLVPSHQYIFLPDPAHPVSALVTVPKDKLRPAGQGGGIYFVDVIVRKATLFEKLFHGIHERRVVRIPTTPCCPAGRAARSSTRPTSTR